MAVHGWFLCFYRKRAVMTDQKNTTFKYKTYVVNGQEIEGKWAAFETALATAKKTFMAVHIYLKGDPAPRFVATAGGWIQHLG